MIMPILAVRDVDASVAFFRDQLGFRHDMSMAGPDGKNIFGIVGLGAAVFGLGSDDRVNLDQPLAPGVQFMIYLPEGQSIDHYYTDVKAKSIQIDDELTDTYWGDRAFTIHDPNGYMLTFAVTIKQVPVEAMEAALRARE
jgi:uncharacterized glyoxalase superfamily protein PhnB